MVDAPSIDVRHLRKVYGEIVAVDDLTFTVPRGSVLGLLGGNGAGKTTTIAMLLGLLEPTAGEINVLGVDVRRHRSHGSTIAAVSARRSTGSCRWGADRRSRRSPRHPRRPSR